VPQVIRALSALLAACLGVGGLAAQEGADTAAREANRDATRLFRDDRPLELLVTADFRQLFRDRDTTEDRRQPATLRWRAPEGDEGEMAVELATRGHSRLLPVVCDFPPIRVHLPEREERPRLWRGQGALKLTVNCKPKDREYEQYVLHEYLIYRLYNLFTDWSYKVRLARATYVQAGGADTVANTWAFFVEDVDDMARRNGGEEFDQPGVRFGDVDQPLLALMGVFQYMVANTDWGLPVLHNVKVVRVHPGFYYTVPYDFDFSGIIKTRYARPSQQLPIRSVRDRLYRGACMDMEMFAPIFARFNAKRAEIEEMHRTLEGFDPRRAEEAVKYLDEFYKTINDPRKAEREFRYICRG